MTTYSEITSGQVDAESIIDTTLAVQWTNNLLAVLENDVSAPNIIKLTDESMSEITDGTTQRHFQSLTNDHDIYTTSGYQIVKHSEWIVQRAGTYTLKFDIRDTHGTNDAGSNTGHVQARFYKNSAPDYTGDVATGDIKTEGDGSWVATTQSGISLNAGDVVSIYVNINTGPRISIRNIVWSAGVTLFGGQT